jgi:hypothetical protein
MAKTVKEYEPPRPGPLRLRDSVRASLYALRHFTQVSLDTLTPPRRLPAAELDVSLVVAVEQALRYSLPDEALACLANGDDELLEYGFDLGQVAEHTRRARQRGCPRDFVAVGCHPDFHAFYCVARDGPRGRAVQIADLDNFDGSLTWYDLGDWLSGMAAGRQDFLAEQHAALAGWQPSPAELSAFAPRLVGGPAEAEPGAAAEPAER